MSTKEFFYGTAIEETNFDRRPCDKCGKTMREKDCSFTFSESGVICFDCEIDKMDAPTLKSVLKMVYRMYNNLKNKKL